jgi:hypothetical protein
VTAPPTAEEAAVFVPTPVQPPESPRVRELSREIRDVITQFQKRYPMTPAEIRQALRHAEGESAGGPRALRAALVAGVAAAGVGVMLVARAGAGAGGGGGQATLPIAVLVAVLAAAAGLAVAIRRLR